MVIFHSYVKLPEGIRIIRMIRLQNQQILALNFANRSHQAFSPIGRATMNHGPKSPARYGFYKASTYEAMVNTHG
jgi:hypothetical protein